MFFSLLCVLTAIYLFFGNPAFAGEIQILKISPKGGTAVIKSLDGVTKTVREGDRIGDRGKVIEIVEGRIVIEESTGQGIETVIIRFEDGKQRVERIRKVGDKVPMLHSPSPKGENQPSAPSSK